MNGNSDKHVFTMEIDRGTFSLLGKLAQATGRSKAGLVRYLVHIEAAKTPGVIPVVTGPAQEVRSVNSK